MDRPHTPCRPLRFVLPALVGLLAWSCAAPPKQVNPAEAPKLQAVNLTDAASPAAHDQPIVLTAAKNEWVSYVVQLKNLPALDGKQNYTLRLTPLTLADGGSSIEADQFQAYQILPMPVDVNRAGYVRHTGQSASNQMLPRALLPLALEGGNLDLAALRSPADATNPQAHPSPADSVLLWIDVQVPPEARAGAYAASVDLTAQGIEQPVARVPVQMTVHDFVLPDERHLMMVGSLEWDSLLRLYPERFEAVSPKLMKRGDANYAQAVRTLDELQTLAQAHRAHVIVPRLQPVVKWPSGRPPQVYWNDYDSVVGPWLRGDMFKDKVPIGHWPLPEIDGLSNYNLVSQRDYWSDAASHFDQFDWLTRSPVFLSKNTTGRASSSESLRLSAEAQSILSVHSRIRVVVPLEDDQVQFATPNQTALVRPDWADRLITANPGLVFNSPIQSWPQDVPRPARWLRTDVPGLNYYIGAGGDERDVRLWSWLAGVPLPPPSLGVQYGPVQFVRWGESLPRTSHPAEPADPNVLAWFYPGSWFGIDQPVPTVQLKWLRRAQQDFEYLFLARQRGEVINSLLMARLMTKPVELAPNQPPDPTFGLMSGAANPQVWDDAISLLSKLILLRDPGQPLDNEKRFELDLQILSWITPQERPILAARTTQWYLTDAGVRGKLIDLKLGLDLYNASDSRPEQNELAWSSVPEGWHIKPQAIPIEALATYRVKRMGIDGQIEVAEVRNLETKPTELTFTDGFRKTDTKLRLRAPVGISDRRFGGLVIDGGLGDWTMDDAIQDGPLVQMLNRPALQSQQMQLATTPSQLFTGWGETDFYVAFKVTGIRGGDLRSTKNFVNYQYRRAWGEDLCQVLVQPVYADGTVGPVLHVAVKPYGHWVERKMDPRLFLDPWQPVEGEKVRYAATFDGPDWRGEIAIPWKAILDEKHKDKGLPALLRFNFAQHRTTTGESASWAGPVDFARDDAFTGVLYLRTPENPGMGIAGN